MNDIIWHWWYFLFIGQGIICAFLFRRIFYDSGKVNKRNSYNDQPENAGGFYFILVPFFIIGCTPLAYIILLVKFFTRYYHGEIPFENTKEFEIVRDYKNKRRKELKQKRQQLRQSNKGNNSTVSKTTSSLRKRILISLYK